MFHAFSDGVGIWRIGCRQRIFQCLPLDGERAQLLTLPLDGEKTQFQCLLWMVKNCNGIWKEVIFLCKCKLMIIFIFSVCHLMKPWWYWHSFSSLGMWVSRVGCGGMYVRHQAFTPFAVCWRALTLHVKRFLDECAIQMKLLMSIDHLCQMLSDDFAIQRGCWCNWCRKLMKYKFKFSCQCHSMKPHHWWNSKLAL